MQSGKQKRIAIMAKRQQKRDQAKAVACAPRPVARPQHSITVRRGRLAPFTGLGLPTFLQRGYYEDIGFTCRDCGARQVWTAEQQQWWYETAGGYVYSTAIRCASCRRARRLAHGGTPKKLRILVQ
ncbi:zinc-ribbon domain containing protein [Chitinimonas sp.]|uniref:zinc-ribbon domain containing protein n=1 Tax=Chitinimonas sp. TaxID=1934313 RepID=UPI0035B2AB11